jgi:AAA family ATP:ADP antiporter
MVLADRYLTLITLGIFLSTIVTTLIKYQFKAIAKESYAADPAALTSFFGDFYGYIALISFMFHVLFSGRIMRWFGLGISLFILPTSLLFGAAAVFLFAPTGFSLWSVILARGLDQGFRHSVDRASIELLYVPMAARIRGQVKSFLDLAVSRWADAIASIVLLVVVNLLHFATGQISWASVVFIVFWLVVVWKLRGEYVLTLRNTIERRDLNAEEILRQLASSEQSVQQELALEMADQQALENSMEWMQFTGAMSGQAQLAELLTHPSPAIRRKALGVVVAQNVPDCEKQVLRFLEMDDDTEARWQAMGYLESENGDGARSAIEGLLHSEDPSLAATAAAKLLTLGGGDHDRAAQVMNAFLLSATQGSEPERMTAARLVGMAPAAPHSGEHIGALLRDQSPEVVRAVLPAVGKLRRREDVSMLVNVLENRQLRREARKALASFGDGILETLNDSLRDRTLPGNVRKEIPRAMSAIGGPTAARLLLSNLGKGDAEFGRPILRELVRLRRGDPKLHFYPEAVSSLITAEIENYHREAMWLGRLGVKCVSISVDRGGEAFICPSAYS